MATGGGRESEGTGLASEGEAVGVISMCTASVALLSLPSSPPTADGGEDIDSESSEDGSTFVIEPSPPLAKKDALDGSGDDPDDDDDDDDDDDASPMAFMASVLSSSIITNRFSPEATINPLTRACRTHMRTQIHIHTPRNNHEWRQCT